MVVLSCGRPSLVFRNVIRISLVFPLSMIVGEGSHVDLPQSGNNVVYGYKGLARDGVTTFSLTPLLRIFHYAMPAM